MREEGTWRRHHGGGIEKEASWRRHYGGGIMEHGNIMEQAGTMEEHFGGPFLETSWKHMGDIWEASQQVTILRRLQRFEGQAFQTTTKHRRKNDMHTNTPRTLSKTISRTYFKLYSISDSI